MDNILNGSLILRKSDLRNRTFLSYTVHTVQPYITLQSLHLNLQVSTKKKNFRLNYTTSNVSKIISSFI